MAKLNILRINSKRKIAGSFQESKTVKARGFHSSFFFVSYRMRIPWKETVEGLAFGNSVYWIRFDEEYSQKVSSHCQSSRYKACALGDGNQDLSTLSEDEWEVAYLDLASLLIKVMKFS
ncbi:hypothetical protein NE237_002592 [Protea cynaroides]|uniref:Uncharacterized protein n=1 Tax=Protea cynaroides TaxID=273540 RepID=A0A9Q0KVJ2_9MAGN|nr:hypothetical protein NE237_002592 [Protea cynaroides]